LERFFILPGMVLFFLGICFQIPGYAQDSIGSSIDCTDIHIRYSEQGSLTREERLAQMDEAFFESLNQFELCQSAKDSQGSSAASGSGAGGGGGESGEATATGSENEYSGDSERLEVTSSLPSSGISGTEEPKPSFLPEDTLSQSESEQGALASTEDMDRTDVYRDPREQGGSGRIPADIPPAHNDDALAAQIRYAAENEKDPEKRAKLWDEYRKYKGLR